MWEVKWCWVEEAKKPFEDGWEPFAVTVNPWDRGVKIWLRRMKS